MTLFEHPLWPTLLPWLYLDPTKQSRWRIEVHRDIPSDVLAAAKLMAVHCPHCPALTNPVQQRDAWGSWYVRISCGSESCWRSGDTSDVAAAVQEAIRGTPRAWSGRLFDTAQPDTENL